MIRERASTGGGREGQDPRVRLGRQAGGIESKKGEERDRRGERGESGA